MMSSASLALLLMRLTAVIAPAERASWVRAMTGEFTSLQDDEQRLTWAMGSASTALYWRGHQELH